jgi:hypothetical protein
MTGRILTLGEASALGDIVHATEFSDIRVARTAGGGRVLRGRARSIGDASGNPDYTSDVRDLYLRVTLDSGSDAFWPVSDLIPEYRSGLLLMGAKV